MRPDRHRDRDRDRDRDRQHSTFALILCLAGAAQAQTSADITFVSQPVLRGVGLGSRPALQLRVDHDTDTGWYGGAFASPVTLHARDQGQLVVYGGRAARLTPDLSWDAGASRTTFLRDREYDYHEFYAGLALPRASARLFYSPAFYGNSRSVYLDVNGSYPLGDHLRLAAHAGLQHAFGDDYGAARNRADARLSLAFDRGDYSLQLGLQAQLHAYLPGAVRARALTASASRHF
jgi:uncharacterized protein (TIGR02001 family)